MISHIKMPFTLNQGLLYDMYNFAKKYDEKAIITKVIEVYLGRIFIAFLFFIVSKLIITFIANRLKYIEKIKKVDKSMLTFSISMYRLFSYTFTLVICLRIIGVPNSSITAVVGAAGIGAGFAAKDLVANFFGGIMILIFKPYKVGHFVEIADKNGEVHGLNVFATELNTVDNKKIIIPNGQIATGHITNYSANHVRRVEIIFGIGYRDNFRQAIGILNEIAENNGKIIQSIEKTIRVKELGAHSVNIIYRVWCRTEDYWDVHFDSIELAKEAFDNVGISIPFPQLDIHFDKSEMKNNLNSEKENLGALYSQTPENKTKLNDRSENIKKDINKSPVTDLGGNDSDNDTCGHEHEEDGNTQ